MEDFNEMIKEVHQELDNVRQVKKCTACECFLDVIEGVKADLEKIDTQESKSAQEDMKCWLSEGNKERHACYGCEECLPISPYNRFSARLKGDGITMAPNSQTVETNSCGCGDACKPLTLQTKTIKKWPIIEGDYILGNPKASVAICTLADKDLPNELKAAGLLEHIAIAGTLSTENLGIERTIRNLTANPNIRYLILCGKDSRGHRAGQAILSLKNNGFDKDKRIIGATGPRPILKNITYEEVEAFRKNVTVIDEIETKDVSRLMEVIKICKDKSTGDRPILPPKVNMPKVIDAQHLSNREWVHDPEGFFVISVNRDDKKIVCEHYAKEGILGEVVKGESAEDIANTAIKRGLISRLDHSAYLGRELAKAEMSIKLGFIYVQDKA